MTEEAKSKPKIKRLKGEAYWELHDLIETGEQKISEYGEWSRKQCRRLKLIPDVTDLVQGVVWNIAASEVSTDNPRKQIGLVSDEAVIAEAASWQAEIDKINVKIAKVVRAIAMAANVRFDQVNARNGTIAMWDSNGDDEFECKLTDN